MDSMVNHYTANKRLRSNDAYTPGGLAGFRPDRATVLYSSILKTLFPQVPVVIGGIEASLRRFTHYDYWADTLMPPILVDARADILVYGMGERPIAEIARQLMQGKQIQQVTGVPQTAFISSSYSPTCSDIILPSLHECLSSTQSFALAFKLIEEESNKLVQQTIVEPLPGAFLVVNPSYPPLLSHEIDQIYDLPFTRLPHPRYAKKDSIPAYEMIKHSVTIHRGCFGGCSFCTISAHQGKFIQSRSSRSILDEVTAISSMPDFKGHITDLGGPSANMYMMSGSNSQMCLACRRPSCIWPSSCPNLNINHQPLIELYARVRQLPGINKATIGSGIRYDMLLNNIPSSHQYMTDIIRYHVSGRLKVAPEHTASHVLKLMRKPSFEQFRTFYNEFIKLNKTLNLNQQIVPYFISSHPGCSLDDMRQLASQLRHLNIQPEQVQDFTPTPMTLSSAMYYTGIDPYSMKSVMVVNTREGKLAQKEKFFWKKS
jgi:uncharacterized radical SAM protein YgiQ